MEVFNINAGLAETKVSVPTKQSTGKAFIEANTVEVSMSELRDEHIIPVFSATNEPLLSHHELIDCVHHITKNWFHDEVVLEPTVRVSHPVKGRIPEAKYKKAIELLPWEQTLYYERMMFCIEVPTIMHDVAGNKLSLTIGGVKSFSTDNLYGKRPGGDQRFQLFIGFKNHVCCNLCVSTDGIKADLSIRSLSDLGKAVEELYQNYNYRAHLEMMQMLSSIKVTESEFAQFIGKSRLYRFLPESRKTSLVPILFGDQQLGAVAKDYFTDENFNAELDSGEINLWRLYNLLTGVNKSTYVDQFLPRAINAQEIVLEIAQHKLGEKESWYMV
jgi:hypothetical protein